MDARHWMSVLLALNFLGSVCCSRAQYICEDEEKTITCDASSRLKINSATYGRDGLEICEGTVSTCGVLNNALVDLSNECDGLTTCTIKATDAEYGDPCVSENNYLGIDFSCKATCEDPEPGAYGPDIIFVVTGELALEGDQRQLACLAHYICDNCNQKFVTCQADGTFSSTTFSCRRDCGPVPALANAIVNGSVIDSPHLNYVCVDGFVGVGNPYITCKNDGTYQIEAFTCEAKEQCPEPSRIANGFISGDGVDVGDIRELNCQSGFLCSHCTENVITCRANLRFSVSRFSCRPDCGEPPPINNAVVEGSLIDGPILIYSCNDNAIPTGDPRITCLSDGSFEIDILFSCDVESQCPEPQEIVNGEVASGGRAVGNTRKLTCLAGFLCSHCTDDTITCQPDLTFSTSPFSCRPDCGTPPTVENADVEGSLLQGPVLFYKCKDNTYPVGDPRITCQSDGTFEDSDFSCVPESHCPNPRGISNGEVSEGGTAVGDFRKLTCLAGFLCSQCTEDTIFCQPDLTFSISPYTCRPDCGTPPTVENADVEGSLLQGPVLFYKCKDNTYPVGDPRITCQRNGTFEDSDFSCVPESHCPDPRGIVNGEVSEGGTAVGDFRKLSCLAGFLCSHCTEDTITCQADLTFSISPFSCRPDCGTPPTVENADVEGSLLQGPVLFYKCKDNTYPVGDPRIICQSDGTFEDSDFSCVPESHCPDPRGIVNGEVSEGGTAVGDFRKLTCLAGFLCSHCTEDTITCQPDLAFSISPYSCRPDCGTPPMVENADVEGSLLQGPVLFYKCKDNTYPVGDPRITCQSDGTFEDSDFACVPESHCPDPRGIVNGEVSEGGTAVGDFRKLTCLAGFLCSHCTEDTITCEADLTFSISPFSCRPDCGAPPTVENADVEGSLIDGEVLWYRCIGNTTPTGDPRITCQSDGTFEESAFYCAPESQCPEPSGIENGKVSEGGREVEDTRTLTCNAGFLCSHCTYNTIVCQDDLTFSTSPFICRPDCGEPPKVANADVEGSLTEGPVLWYKCKVNTNPVGDPRITCKKDGTFEIGMFSCVDNLYLPYFVISSTIAIISIAGLMLLPVGK